MSLQLDKLLEVFDNNREFVRVRMIEQADMIINRGVLDDQFAYSMLFADGSFLPFTEGDHPASKEYADTISEHGNETDECIMISTLWVYMLMSADSVKYEQICGKFLDIAANGL